MANIDLRIIVSLITSSEVPGADLGITSQSLIWLTILLVLPISVADDR